MRLLGVAIACALAVAACSSDSTGASSGNNGLGVSTPTTPTANAAQQPGAMQQQQSPLAAPTPTGTGTGAGAGTGTGTDNGTGMEMGTSIDMSGAAGASVAIAGSAAPPPAPQAGAAAPPEAPPSSGVPPPEETPPEPVAQGCELAVNECDIDSGFLGDENCILPPPPGEGFQIHTGPTDYNNPGQFLLQNGDEVNNYYPATSGNTEDIYYYWRQYRMRPGSHHLIVSGGSSLGGSLGGRRLGGSQNPVKDNPDCGIIAPENEGVGMPLAANTSLSVNIHAYNFSGVPSIHEAWVNFWYRDPAIVKEEAKEMFSMGGLAMAIPPGAHQTLGPYSCGVSQAGRVLTMYGHVHANTVRFSAWRVRGGQRELIQDAYDWEHPPVYEYNSVTDNPAPVANSGINGAVSGILDLQPGDALEWECEVQNQQNTTLRFTNEVYAGEMCIMIGDTVGPSVACQYP